MLIHAKLNLLGRTTTVLLLFLKVVVPRDGGGEGGKTDFCLHSLQRSLREGGEYNYIIGAFFYRNRN